MVKTLKNTREILIDKMQLVQVENEGVLCLVGPVKLPIQQGVFRDRRPEKYTEITK